MFRIFVLNIVLVISSFVYGQGDSQKISPVGNGYSQWLSESISKLSAQLNLVPLNDVQKATHYRIWFEGQVIDLVKDIDNQYTGSLTNFANASSYMKNKEVQSHSTYEELNTTNVKQLFDLLQELEKIDVENIWKSSQWNIDQVKLLCIVEQSNGDKYVFDEYWIPKKYKMNQTEILQLQHFASSCADILGLSKKFDSFYEKLPNGCYVTSVHTFRCKNDERSDKVNRWLLSERPIDSMLYYLNEQDWAYMASSNDWVLYNTVIVNFKLGKITKVNFEIQSGMIYHDDIYSSNIKRLKKQVKKALLNLDLSLFEPPDSYKVNLALTFHRSNKELIWGSW